MGGTAQTKAQRALNYAASLQRMVLMTDAELTSRTGGNVSCPYYPL